MIDYIHVPNAQSQAGAAANARSGLGHWPSGYGAPLAANAAHAGPAYPWSFIGEAGAAPFGYDHGVPPTGYGSWLPVAQGPAAPLGWIGPDAPVYAGIAPGIASDAGAARGAALVPAIEMAETVEQLILTVELPGVAEPDVRILLAGDMITIEARKEAPPDLRVAGHYLAERRYGTLMRTVRLPYAPRSGEVSAELKDGLLTIRLAKAAQLRGEVEQIHLKVA